MSRTSAALDRHGGALPTWLIARLTGLSRDQLRAWNRSGLLVPAARRGRRGVSHRYDWNGYRQARLAAKLLALGVKPQYLRGVLRQFIDVVPANADWPVTVTENRALVNPNGQDGQTAERTPQGAFFDFVASGPIDRERVTEQLQGILDEAALSKIWRDLDDEDPLGLMHAFGDSVTMDPDVVGGAPTIKGRRIETAQIADLHQGGMTLEQIADAYRLKRDEVRRALDFEIELGRPGFAYAPAG